MVRYIKIDSFEIFKKQLITFMQSVPFGRYLSDKSVDANEAIQHELSVLDDYINTGGLCYVATTEDGDITGIIGFHFSSWDTEVLKKRTAIIKYFLIKELASRQDKDTSTNLIDIFHTWAEKNSIDVTTAKLETQYFTPVIVLQEHGYIFYECNTIKTLDLTTDNHWNFKNVKFHYATAEDLENLKKLALKNTFKKSHFYLDEKFDSKNVDNLYAKWINSALNSNQSIILTEHNSSISGVFIYDIITNPYLFKKKVAVWKFAAVETSLRHKGLGLALFQATLQSCIDQKVDIIDTSLAEKNILSQKLHDKFGFKLVYTLYTFHKWFK